MSWSFPGKHSVFVVVWIVSGSFWSHSTQFQNHLKDSVDILYVDPSAGDQDMTLLATIEPNELYPVPIDKTQSHDYYIRRSGYG